MGFTDADLRFVAAVATGDEARASARLLEAWRDRPDHLEAHLEDERVLRRLMSEQQALVTLSPRFLFSILLRRIRRDLAETPYTVERVHSDGRVVVFDAGLSYELLRAPEMLEYLVELLVSFERAETVTVRQPPPARRARRLSTMSIDDMLVLASLAEPALRPMVFRRIGDIVLFLTGLFPDAVLRGRRVPFGATILKASPGGHVRLEDLESEGRRFYRMAAQRLTTADLALARILTRLADEFTAARKPLTVLSERYVAWARPHWKQTLP
jgi:hypothetical protein